ncbi:hypothetical protein [Planctomicrobium sp. SH664]|uniref:hypothetical protein n=1 Tax=Planctomicrobium sp. SH664 TaxID=3448125 RepID=UPI003F5CA577
MASTRAPAVAEVLWELKRADKVARYGVIAARAGFNAGAKGRAMETCLKTVRKEWPHLDWWRAIPDDGTLLQGDEQATELKGWGADVTPAKDSRVSVLVDESRIMVWDLAPASAKVEVATAAE